MCPIPPTAIYERIANNSEAPQQVRDAALNQLNQASLQNAVSEAVVDKPSAGNGDFTCTIYSLGNKIPPQLLKNKGAVDNPDAVASLPGVKVQDTTGFVAKNPDGTIVQDLARQKTFDGFRATYNFYKTVFNRNSIDGQGMEIRATIHASRGYDNASWFSGLRQMIFGDGGRFDGRGWLIPSQNEIDKSAVMQGRDLAELSNWLACYSLDIIGHELTHGVVRFTAKLGIEQNKKAQNAATEQDKKVQWATYSEAGTLNEHIADCFGVMLKHFVSGHKIEAGSWDMAPDHWSKIAMDSNKWNENYLRTFKVPKDKSKSPDSDPKHWKDKQPFDTFNEDGDKGLDPHINCGIGNHAFYRAALAFKDYTPAALPDKDYSWKTVGKIWYDALTDNEFTLPENQTFKGWRNLTVKYAEKHFSSNGKKTMEDAWKAVGL